MTAATAVFARRFSGWQETLLALLEAREWQPIGHIRPAHGSSPGRAEPLQLQEMD